jgi:hypothetical protein
MMKKQLFTFFCFSHLLIFGQVNEASTPVNTSEQENAWVLAVHYDRHDFHLTLGKELYFEFPLYMRPSLSLGLGSLFQLHSFFPGGAFAIGYPLRSKKLQIAPEIAMTAATHRLSEITQLFYFSPVLGYALHTRNTKWQFFQATHLGWGNEVVSHQDGDRNQFRFTHFQIKIGTRYAL